MNGLWAILFFMSTLVKPEIEHAPFSIWPLLSMISTFQFVCLLLVVLGITTTIVLRRVYGEHLTIILQVMGLRALRLCSQWPTAMVSEVGDACYEKLSIISIKSTPPMTDGKEMEWTEESIDRIKQMDVTRVYRVEYTVRGSVGKSDPAPWVALYGPWLPRHRHVFPPYGMDIYTQFPSGLSANDPVIGISFSGKDGKDVMADSRVLSLVEGIRGPMRHDPSQGPEECDAHQWPREWVLRDIRALLSAKSHPSDLFIHFEINGPQKWVQLQTGV